MMVRFVFLCLIAASTSVLTGSAWAGDFPTVDFPMDPNGGITFSMPSHNIDCTFIPRGGSKVSTTSDGLALLSCDRAQPTYLRFSMGERGKVDMIKDPGEQPCCTDLNQLEYGKSWQMAPFHCDSTAMGLTCERTDGHGFFISKANIKVY